MTLHEVHVEIAVHLDEIRKLFKNPKITLLVRNPDQNDGDVLETEDDLNAAIQAIERLKNRDPKFKPTR